MSNQNILDIINIYLKSSATEKTIVANMINTLEKIDPENLVCLQVEDNTLNGTDKDKFSWRAQFVNLKTEEDFYIEASKLSSGLFKSSCFKFDDHEDIKMINI